MISTLEDGNKLNKLSFKITTTENDMNEEMQDTAAAPDKGSTLEDAEEGKFDGGLRQRGAPAAKPFNPKLSIISQKYDIDGDGQLDEAEQALRDMDTENKGYLTNDKVYKVMVEQMKLQQDVFSLKRLATIFLVVILFLSLATLGTSFAAATLAKDTDVKNGVLVVKDGSDTVATSNAAITYMVSEGAIPSDGRRTEASGGITITRSDADAAYINCDTTYIRLERTCIDEKTLDEINVKIPLCPSSGETKVQHDDGRTDYIFNEFSGAVINGDVKINCPADQSQSCVVTFPDSAPVGCFLTPDTELVITTTNTPVVLLGRASDYAILSKTGITTVPTSVITGDIAVSPITATAMTGFSFVFGAKGMRSSSQIVNEGNAFAADDTGDIGPRLTTAVSNMNTAYNDAAERINNDPMRINLGGGSLGGPYIGAYYGGPANPLTPGVYTFSTDTSNDGSLVILSDIHFKGTEHDIFIIQIAQNLAIDTNIKVILQSNFGTYPKPENIFWQVAGHVILGAGAHMEGILLVKTDVTFITGSSLNGRVLAQTACNLQSATITAPGKGTEGNANLASLVNGALAAVAKDTVSGYSATHAEQFVNDGVYGNSRSWISASVNSWVKIDLGGCYVVDTVVFGRDQVPTPQYADRGPGLVTVSVAKYDAIYRSGDATDDGTEYTQVLSTNDFTTLSLGQTATASVTTKTKGRFVKFQVQNNGACIDELEIYGMPCGNR